MSTSTNIDLASLLASADRRTLAAVVTHLSGDPKIVPDLRDRAQIEKVAAKLLPPFLAGEKTVEAPSDEVLQAAMSLAAGFKVVIIGAGVSGVLAAIRLEQLGVFSFTILEKNPEPGGTWWQNSYPGCRVDTPSLLYSYSFAPDPGWP